MFDPSRYAGRRRLYLTVFWLFGFWAAERYAARLHRQCLARIRKLEEALWTEFKVEAFKPAYVDRLYNTPRGTAPGAWQLSQAEYEAKKAEIREAKAQAYGYHQVIPGYKPPTYQPALQMPTVATLLEEVTPRCPCGGVCESHINRREMRPDRPYHDWQLRTVCTSCRTDVITPVNSHAADATHLRAAVELHMRRYQQAAAETRRLSHTAAPIRPGDVFTADQANQLLYAADLISSAEAARLVGDGGPDTEAAPAPRETLP